MLVECFLPFNHPINIFYINKKSYSFIVSGQSGLPTIIQPSAFLTNSGENTVAGSLLPAMSQSYTRAFFPLILIILSTKSIIELALLDVPRVLVNAICFVCLSVRASQLKKEVISDDLPDYGAPTTKIL